VRDISLDNLSYKESKRYLKKIKIERFGLSKFKEA